VKYVSGMFRIFFSDAELRISKRARIFLGTLDPVLDQLQLGEKSKWNPTNPGHIRFRCSVISSGSPQQPLPRGRFRRGTHEALAARLVCLPDEIETLIILPETGRLQL